MLHEGPLPSLDFGELNSLIQLLLRAFDATVGYFTAARMNCHIKETFPMRFQRGAEQEKSAEVSRFIADQDKHLSSMLRSPPEPIRGETPPQCHSVFRLFLVSARWLLLPSPFLRAPLAWVSSKDKHKDSCSSNKKPIRLTHVASKGIMVE